MVSISNRPAPSSWSRATLLAILLHVGVGAGLYEGGAFEARPLPEPEPDVVQVVFAPREEPQAFTELPQDRADEPAEEPDFLSNVDSRARDLTAGGDEARPRSDGLVEIPQVEMSPAVPPPQAEAKEEEEEEEEEEEDPTPAREPAPRTPAISLANRLSDPIADLMNAPSTPVPGASDIRQEPMRNLSPGADLQGEISLSTTAWDYAWWVQSFRRTVLGNWSPPSGFKFGLIGGWTLVEIEVAPDGRLMRADILDSDGHKALHESSVRAFTRSGAFDALPDDFPDETLVVRVRMIYSLRR